MLAVLTSHVLSGGLALAYVAGGAVVAGLLEKAGQPRGAVLGALVAWPLMLPLLGRAPAAPRVAGPLRQRIDGVLASLKDTLGDPAAGDVPWTADLDGLRASLHAADARLALVDRLLDDDQDEDDAVARSAAGLREARTQSVAAIEAVLSEVQQLRLQVGVVALAGDSGELGERLRELSGRAAALGEVAATSRPVP